MTETPSPASWRRPRLWPHLFLALLLLLAWVVALEIFLRPRMLAPGGSGPAARLALFLAPPAAFSALVYGFMWWKARRDWQREQQQAEAAKQAEARRQAEAAKAEAEAKARAQFTLDVLGVAFRVGPYEETDLPDPGEGLPLTMDADPEDGGLSETLRRCLEPFPEGWPIPTFVLDGREDPTEEAVTLVLERSRQRAGLEGHPLAIQSVRLLPEAPELLGALFDTFEAHPALPAVLLVAIAPDPLALLLGRSDRVEAMRSLQALAESPVADTGLQPFWVKAPPVLEPRAKSAFTPGPLLPRPWSLEQIDAFQAMPLRGRLHRPQIAEAGAEGGTSRVEAWATALGLAMESLPSASKLTRICFDHGPVEAGRKLVPMASAFQRLEPDFDLDEHTENLYPLLRTAHGPVPLHPLALALLRCEAQGEPAAGANLREPAAGLLLTLSPAPVSA